MSRLDAKHLLLIGVGLMGRPYVQAARRLGVRVSAVESAASAPATAQLVDQVFVASSESDEAWVETAFFAARECEPDGVIAFSEPHVIAAALVQQSLGLPGPSLHASVLSRNKGLQRARFAANGLRQPDHLVARSLSETREWVESRLPVVIKPLSAAGSAGVELVRDLAAFDAAAVRRSTETPILVEVAVDGPEYSWEGLVRDGDILFANITAKETTGPPNFVEICHRAAPALSMSVTQQIHRLAGDVVHALDMQTGLVHLELRLANDGPAIIEVAVRTPGDFIMDMLGLTYGFDWFESAVRLSLGLPIQQEGARCCFAASLFFTADPGVVTSIYGIEEVRQHEAVVAADIEVAPGEVVHETRSSGDRVGWALLRAGTRAELGSALSFAQSRVRVDVDPRTRRPACAVGDVVVEDVGVGDDGHRRRRCGDEYPAAL